MNLAPIRITIAGVDRFSKHLASVEKRTQKFARGMKSVGRGVTTGVTLPVVGATIAVGRAAVSFDSAMNVMESKANVTSKSIADLRVQAKDLGSSTRFSATQAAEGMQFLAQAGYDTGEIYTAITPVLGLAAATNLDLGRAADITSNIMGGFGWTAEKTTDAVDILTTVTASANVDMEQLGETMKYVAPVARDFGASMKDTATIAGFLGNIGIQGTMAGTAMKKMFSSITSGAPKVTETFDKLGVKVADNQGNIRDFSAILGDFAVAVKKLPQIEQAQVIEKVFGERAKAGISALVADVSGSNSMFEKLQKNMKDTTGNTDKMVGIMNKGAVGGLRNFMSALEGIAIAIGESGLLDWIAKITRKMAEWFRGISKLSPGLLKLMTIFGLLAAALGPLLVILGSVIAAVSTIATKIAIAGGVAAVFAKIIGAIGAVAAAVFSPIGLLIAAIAAHLIVVGIVAKKVIGVIMSRWDKIKPFFVLIGNLIKDTLGGAFEWLMESPIGTFFKWIGEKIEMLYGGIKKIGGWLLDTGLAKLTDIAGKIVGSDRMAEAGFKGYAAGSAAANKTAEKVEAGKVNVANKNEMAVKVQAPEGYTVEVESKKGNATLTEENGPTMGGFN